MEVKIWVLTGLVSFLVTLFIAAFWFLVRSINNRLDKLIDQNEVTGKELTRQNGEISQIKREVSNNRERLNDHAKRLRDIELENAKKPQ